MRLSTCNRCQQLKLTVPVGNGFFSEGLAETCSSDWSTKETMAIGGNIYAAVLKKLLGRGKLTLLDNEPRLGRIWE